MTLLHADYLLKELTTGIEVNGKGPFFELRPTKDGLLKRLPSELQAKLRPIMERVKELIDPASENSHRFWFEVKEVSQLLNNLGIRV